MRVLTIPTLAVTLVFAFLAAPDAHAQSSQSTGEVTSLHLYPTSSSVGSFWYGRVMIQKTNGTYNNVFFVKTAGGPGFNPGIEEIPSDQANRIYSMLSSLAERKVTLFYLHTVPSGSNAAYEAGKQVYVKWAN